MFDKIKQNSKTIIEVSYLIETLLKERKKDNRKILDLQKKMYNLIQDTNAEIKMLRAKTDKNVQ